MSTFSERKTKQNCASLWQRTRQNKQTKLFYTNNIIIINKQKQKQKTEQEREREKKKKSNSDSKTILQGL